MPDGTVPGGEPELASYRGDLTDWLRARLGTGDLTLGAITLLPGGAVQRNWRLEIETGDQVQSVVLRVGPDMPLPESRPKSQEFMLLRLAHARGLAVAEPLWLEPTGTVIGREFIVSEFCDGTADRNHLLAHAAGPVILEKLGVAMAEIHAMGVPDGLVPDSPRDRVETLRGWVRALGDVPAGVALGLDWLDEHVPDSGTGGVAHRDFRTGNFLLHDDRLSAVLDWEFAGAGDVAEDIGWFCARCWRGENVDWDAGGLGSRDAFYRAYTQAGGRSPEPARVHFWEVFAHLRWALIAMQQRARAAAGEYPVWELEEAGNRVPGLAQSIQEMLGAD
jgi:aminoglycoside phosphotransferase (APT) family kinase protein